MAIPFQRTANGVRQRQNQWLVVEEIESEFP